MVDFRRPGHMCVWVLTSLQMHSHTTHYFVAILQRSVVEVAWILTGTTNIYRLGHKGKVCVLISMVIFYYWTTENFGSCEIWQLCPYKAHSHVDVCSLELFMILQLLFDALQVDLKCITPAEGGYYYPDHLPVLGKLSVFVHSLFHPYNTAMVSRMYTHFLKLTIYLSHGMYQYCLNCLISILRTLDWIFYYNIRLLTSVKCF